MKKTGILLLALLLGFTVTAQPRQAQRPVKDKKALIEKKLAFLRENLALTDKEYARFAPVMKNYEMKRWQLFDEKRNLMKAFKTGKENMSDKELTDLLDKVLQKDRQLFELKMAYYEQVKKILPVRKFALLLKYELRFRKRLLQRMHRRGVGPQRFRSRKGRH